MMQEFVQSVKDVAKRAVNEIHTAVPGVITSYDPATNRADVQPKAKIRKPDGEMMNYPKVCGVPVMFPCTGDTAIAFPVSKGDGVLLVFSETPLDYFMSNQENAADVRYDMTNAVAVTGFEKGSTSVIEKANMEKAVIIISGSTEVKIKGDGVHIKGSLTVDGSIAADNFPK